MSCVKLNLLTNPSFDTRACDSSSTNPIYANGFITDLKMDCAPPTNGAGHYHLMPEITPAWNGNNWANLKDHTGNGGNLLLLDGVQKNFAPLGYEAVLWKQSITGIQGDSTYSFSFWYANAGGDPGAQLAIRIGTSFYEPFTVLPYDHTWRQYCVQWTAPRRSLAHTDVQIVQRQLFTNIGIDVAIDDMVFGRSGKPIAEITAASPTTICTGQSVLLQSASGGTGLYYQWFRNGEAIGGATSPSYTATSSGAYTLQISSSAGCAGNSNTITVTLTTGSDADSYTVTSSPGSAWTRAANPFGSAQPIRIHSELRIAANVQLVIQGMRFEFGPNARVTLEPGAQLTMESDGTVPTIFTAYDCPNIMWNGLTIMSADKQTAKLVMKPGSVIEHARTGVTNSTTGKGKSQPAASGYVTATGAIFRNNFVAVQLASPVVTTQLAQNPLYNPSSFSDCLFISSAYLKDRTTYPDGLHKTFVDLSYIEGPRFTGNTLINTFYSPHPAEVNNVYDEAIVTRNKGITSLNAQYHIYQGVNSFTNLWAGIDYNSSTSSGGQVFQNLECLSNAYGIILRGGSGMYISTSTFGIHPSYTEGATRVPKFFVGINARGSTELYITNNSFSEGYGGIITVDASKNGSISTLTMNRFENVGRTDRGKGQGIYSLYDNHALQVSCNNFDVRHATVQNHWVTEGSIPEQGSCLTEPPANTFEGAEPVFSDIYIKSPHTGFIYNIHNDTVPILKPKMRMTVWGSATADVTATYVHNCRQDYNSQVVCMILSHPIEPILTALYTALPGGNDSLILSYVYQALHYYAREDSTGLAVIAFLNELPYEPAKWQLVAEYIRRERYPEAQSLLAILPSRHEADDISRAFYELQIRLYQAGQTLSDMNASDSTAMHAISLSDAPLAYEAQAIMHYLYGTGYRIPLPYVPEEGAERKGTLIPELLIYPNPSGEAFSIRHATERGVSALRITDVTGKMIASLPYTADMMIPVGAYRNGIYFVSLYQGDLYLETHKLTIIH